MAKQRSNLSDRQRQIIIVAAVIETALKTAMLIDLRRRPANQVRGPKWLWASTALINTAGLAPLSYFVVGRTPSHR
jgi:NADH:ubiquinone oxidoreductase subunit B-like Fe-S oxidoreductase